MKTKLSNIVISVILFTAVCASEVCSQEQPVTSTPTQSTEKERTNGEAAPERAAAPVPTPEADFWKQETMTGDWGETRSRWKEKGVDLEFKQVNFFQGVASGGIDENSEYNGKAEMTWKFDLAKISGWKWWSAELKSEMRFGGPVLGGVGTINPVNTAAIVPAAAGTVVTVIDFGGIRIPQGFNSIAGDEQLGATSPGKPQNQIRTL